MVVAELDVDLRWRRLLGLAQPARARALVAEEVVAEGPVVGGDVAVAVDEAHATRPVEVGEARRIDGGERLDVGGELRRSDGHPGVAQARSEGDELGEEVVAGLLIAR